MRLFSNLGIFDGRPFVKKMASQFKDCMVPTSLEFMDICQYNQNRTSFHLSFGTCGRIFVDKWAKNIYAEGALNSGLHIERHVETYIWNPKLWQVTVKYQYQCYNSPDEKSEFNSLRPRPTRRHFADDIFKRIFENENEWISPRISLKFVPDVRINNIPTLVQITAWRRPGDKPLSEPMMVSLLTHICVTRPQLVLWLSITCDNSFQKYLQTQHRPKLKHKIILR